MKEGLALGVCPDVACWEDCSPPSQLLPQRKVVVYHVCVQGPLNFEVGLILQPHFRQWLATLEVMYMLALHSKQNG